MPIAPRTHETRGRFATARLVGWDFYTSNYSEANFVMRSEIPINIGDRIAVFVARRQREYRVETVRPLGSNEFTKQGAPLVVCRVSAA